MPSEYSWLMSKVVMKEHVVLFIDALLECKVEDEWQSLCQEFINDLGSHAKKKTWTILEQKASNGLLEDADGLTLKYYHETIDQLRSS